MDSKNEFNKLWIVFILHYLYDNNRFGITLSTFLTVFPHHSEYRITPASFVSNALLPQQKTNTALNNIMPSSNVVIANYKKLSWPKKQLSYLPLRTTVNAQWDQQRQTRCLWRQSILNQRCIVLKEVNNENGGAPGRPQMLDYGNCGLFLIWTFHFCVKNVLPCPLSTAKLMRFFVNNREWAKNYLLVYLWSRPPWSR
jgi:hypothetical protein